MAFHLAYSILSGVYFSMVRIELQVSAHVQCLCYRCHSRMGSGEGNLHGGKTNFKLSSLGEKWLRSGAEKSGCKWKN